MAVVFRRPELVRPASFHENSVVIAFRDPIQKTRSRTDPYREILEASLFSVLGKVVTVETILFSHLRQGGLTADLV